MFLLDNEINEKDFKKQWSDVSTVFLIKRLEYWFRENYDIENVEEVFGLPYTDTSECAMLSNTNCLFEIQDGINLDFFTLTDKYEIVAVGSDFNSNEYCFYLK